MGWGLRIKKFNIVREGVPKKPIHRADCLKRRACAVCTLK